jgi:hypothetical protein
MSYTSFIHPRDRDIPCWFHINKGYKKGCKDCFEVNKAKEDYSWHDTWERDNFGDN